MKKIAINAEIKKGILDNASFELINKAFELKNFSNIKIHIP